MEKNKFYKYSRCQEEISISIIFLLNLNYCEILRHYTKDAILTKISCPRASSCKTLCVQETLLVYRLEDKRVMQVTEVRHTTHLSYSLFGPTALLLCVEPKLS
jgi:hypothetical protein